jgi:hypothetical protein
MSRHESRQKPAGAFTVTTRLPITADAKYVTIAPPKSGRCGQSHISCCFLRR